VRNGGGGFLVVSLVLLGALQVVLVPNRGVAQETADTEGRPAHVHAGSCGDASLGEIVASLSDLTGIAGEMTGQSTAAPVESSFSTVPIPFAALLTADHALDISRSTDEIETAIACGEIGGAPDVDGSLIIGLKEQNQSGYTGIAYLSGSADGTATFVSVFAAEGLAGGGRGPGAPARGVARSSRTAAEPEILDSSLTEWDIDLATTVPAGLVAFDTANDGTMRHSLAIEGEDVSAQLPRPLHPGEAGRFETKLAPGTYTLYCPIGDHRQRGMEIELTIAE